MKNARLGLICVLLYAAVYLAFVLLNAFAPEFMERPSVGGVNFAVTSGFALIAFAFFLALVYGLMCRSDTQDSNTDRSNGS